MIKKVVAASVALAMMTSVSLASVYAGYAEIECSTDPVFSENACNQCFDGGAKGAGANIGEMDDVWVNNSSTSQVMFEETQNMHKPEMINLNTAKVEWAQTPSSEDFWEYTDELKALYDSENYFGNVLPAGEKVTWIKSKFGSTYSLTKNEAGAGENIGLLVFPIHVNPVLESGELSIKTDIHKECVLFKSGDAKAAPKAPKQLPKTGPAEFLILLVLAMILAFGVLRFKKS